jgi:Domain of unknown function (DUF1508)
MTTSVAPKRSYSRVPTRTKRYRQNPSPPDHFRISTPDPASKANAENGIEAIETHAPGAGVEDKTG